MNTCLSTEENSSDKKIKKKCRETILAESIEFLYKISTFLLIKRSTKSQDSSEATPTNQTPFKVFTYLFHTILALNSGRFWLVFINDEARKQDVIVLVLVLTFCNFFIACCIFYRLFCAESFRQLRERLLELEIFTDEKTLIKIYQQSKTSIILHILFGTFISIAFWVLLITLPSKDSFWLIYLSYPVTDVSGKYYYTALVLTMILMFVGSFWTSVSAYIANWLLIFLQKEFDCHAKAFRVDFRLADISMKHHLSVAERSSRIFEMCKAHNNLCDVLESMNFLYRGHFGFSLSIIIALVCLLIYELIHRSTETFEFGFLTCIVISNLIGTIINIKKCIALHLSAHQLTDDLYQIDLRNLSSEASLKVSIFLTRLTSSPIGISVAGLFVIDHSTILMLSGTLLTYIIVVIQTKDSGCGCQSNNNNNNITTPGI